MCLYIDVHKIVIKVIAEYKKGKYRRTTEKPYVMMRNMCERLVLCVHLCGHQSHQPGIFYKCLVRFFSSPLLSLSLAIVGEYFIRLSSFLFVALVSATDTLLLLWMNRPFPLRTTKPEQNKKTEVPFADEQKQKGKTETGKK